MAHLLRVDDPPIVRPHVEEQNGAAGLDGAEGFSQDSQWIYDVVQYQCENREIKGVIVDWK